MFLMENSAVGIVNCGVFYIIALVIFMENNLPKRKHPRLDHYDYSTAGAYFITICTQSRRCLLSRIVARMASRASGCPPDAVNRAVAQTPQ